MSVYTDLLARADNLERHPFESATMAEAGKLAAKHLRDVARDMGNSDTSIGSAVLAICEGDDTDSVKVRRIWRMAAQDSALPHMHINPPKSVRDVATCPSCDPHEVFYVQFADGLHGKHIRKWDRTPFEGARMCRVEIPASVDTLPKGQDGETRLGAGKGSAVTPKAGDAH